MKSLSDVGPLMICGTLHVAIDDAVIIRNVEG